MGSGDEDLGKEETMGDLSLYFKVDTNDEVSVILGIYLDKSIGAGDRGFAEFSKTLSNEIIPNKGNRHRSRFMEWK